MPRPDGGYKNAAGKQVPGVHDITNAYVPKPALVGWAYGRGKAGLPLYEQNVLDIGSTVHAMAELDLRGRDSAEIEACPKQALRDPDHRATAWRAYEAFVAWREANSVRPIAHEVTIVSETHQLGGTPDCIAWIGGEVGLLDFKTCTKAPANPYHEQLLAMAAHATLWNEQNPRQKVQSMHIVYLAKDGSGHKHHSYAGLESLWLEFRQLLMAFAIKNGMPRPRSAGAELKAEVAALKAEIEAARVAAALISKGSEVSPLKPKRPRKPRAKPAPAQLLLPPPIILVLPLQLSMAELLRNWGHVPPLKE
jgi:hypothetical protein